MSLLHRWLASHRSPESRLARRVATGATVLFVLVVCGWKPWDLFARGGFSTDFYDAQAHAFLRGRLDIPAQVAGPEGFLIDGKTYLYFGPVLAIARIPFALFGHWADGRLTRLSLTVGFFSACTMARHLAVAVGALWDRTVSPARQALLVAAVACSPALALAGWNTIYHETEMWAFVLFLATSVALLRLWMVPTRHGLVVAFAVSVCTVLTRSSVGYGALGATGLVGLLLWRRNRKLAIGSLATMVGGVAISIAVNLAKFGTMVDLPADRQLLTLQSPQRAAWFAGNNGSFFSLRFLPTTIPQYLRPDTIRFERLLPFIRFGPLAPEYGSYPLEGNTPASSLPVAATLLTVLAVIGVVVLVRRRAWVPLCIVVGAAVAAAPSFLIGFVANRYLVDMLPLLVIPAAAAVAAAGVPSRLSRRWAQAGAIALVVWGTWVNVALATWIQQLKEPGFTALRYSVDESLFGGTPPYVVTLSPVMPVPRDGVVAIDGNCDGLYIAEQGHWVALELGDGTRQVTGTVANSVSAVTMVAPYGSLELHGTDGTVTATFVPEVGDTVEGTPVHVDASGYQLHILSDPVTGRLEVRVNGTQVLFAFAAPTLGEATFSSGFVIDHLHNGGTPICNNLRERI